MTAAEVFELTTKGGTSDFAETVAVCERAGAYCLIGGLAVNCYVEPVYTVDADLVVVSRQMPIVSHDLQSAGFEVREFEHSVNAQRHGSDLRIQFTTDARYQDFPSRAASRQILGTAVRVATLKDVFQGKLWAYSDPTRRLTKRKKDELDLLRLAEAYLELRDALPLELRSLL